MHAHCPSLSVPIAGDLGLRNVLDAARSLPFGVYVVADQTVRPLLATAYVIDAAIGASAPQSATHALLVAPCERTHHLDAGADRGGQANSDRLPVASDAPAAIVVVAARTGACLVGLSGREPFSSASGFLVDLALRVLGSPTAASPIPVRELALVAWLDRIAQQVGQHPTTASWAQVTAGLSPADTPREIGVHLAHQFGSWGQLRDRIHASTLHAAPAFCAGPLAHARWFDDGSFARWMLGTYPSVRFLRDVIGSHASAHVRAGIDQVIVTARTTRPPRQ